ncbi:hypothetical protein CCZ27_02050 [Thauera sinica]|nr:hypothetical protein CCZ27_02050 [Thauera sp. K11]
MIALGIGLAVTCTTPAPVHAEDANTLAPDPAPFVLGRRVIDTETLAEQRGGADTHLSDIHAVGSVSEVQAYDLSTGHNSVTDGALAGTSGIPMLIQNSGNGVLIQNAVIVNVEVR